VLAHCGTFEGTSSTPAVDAAAQDVAVVPESSTLDAAVNEVGTDAPVVDAADAGRACPWLARGSAVTCVGACTKEEFAALGKVSANLDAYSFAPFLYGDSLFWASLGHRDGVASGSIQARALDRSTAVRTVAQAPGTHTVGLILQDDIAFWVSRPLDTNKSWLWSSPNTCAQQPCAPQSLRSDYDSSHLRQMLPDGAGAFWILTDHRLRHVHPPSAGQPERVIDLLTVGDGSIAVDDQLVYMARKGADSLLGFTTLGMPQLNLTLGAAGSAWGAVRVAVDCTHIYLLRDADAEPDQQLYRLPKTASGPSDLFLLARLPKANTFAMTLDMTHVYLARPDGGGLLRIPKVGGEPVQIALGDPWHIVTNDTHVYFDDHTTRKWWRIAK